MKEKFFNMFDAKHAKGMRAEFGLVLTYMMLSRARFVNSCSPEVDILMRVPTHTKDQTKNVCVW